MRGRAQGYPAGFNRAMARRSPSRSASVKARMRGVWREHLLPLYVALGAAGPGARAERIHTSATHGVLRMDAYAFGGDATARAA